MDRAYDLMGWSFIEQVLLKFGFHRKFVDLIMEFIRVPEFAMLVNGSLIQWFRSTIGLHLGDLMSPYFFIIGEEVFVRMVKKAHISRRL